MHKLYLLTQTSKVLVGHLQELLYSVIKLYDDEDNVYASLFENYKYVIKIILLGKYEKAVLHYWILYNK